MTADIAIFGAGGFGREIACLIEKINKTSKEPRWNIIGFFDDGKEKGKRVSHYGEIIGGVDDLNVYKKNLAIVIAIGDPKILKHVVQKITNKNVYYPNIISPDVRISDIETLEFGKGNIIQYGCSFSCDVSLGDFNVLNTMVALGHDVSIGSYNSFMPSTRISGGVIIGDNNFFGVGSIVLQYIKIIRRRI